MKYKPRGSWDEDKPVIPALSVFEPEDDPQDTGLLDQYGNKLYRQAERRRIGFVVR